MTRPKPIKTYLFADTETAASVVFGFFDALSIPGVTWPKLIYGEASAPMFDIKVVAARRKPFACRGGVRIAPDLHLSEAQDADLICIPNISVAADRSPRGRFAEESEWLKQNFAAGATIGSACSGSILLAETGLLDDQEATSHWAYRDLFRRYYPKVDLKLQRILVTSGEGNRLVTAGGFGSWQDLSLHLIARFCGVEHAIRTAKVYVFCDHQEGQLPYATIARHIQHADAIVRDCQLWAADHYAAEQPVARMVEMSGLDRTTFTRRFKTATGYRPLEYVHILRVEEAKQMLERGVELAEEIAAQVGYDDARSFRRTFKKYTGLTPSGYRRRFSRKRLLMWP